MRGLANVAVCELELEGVGGALGKTSEQQTAIEGDRVAVKRGKKTK